MSTRLKYFLFVVSLWACSALEILCHGLQAAQVEVKAWQGSITIPTYLWQEDVNPKFWALETGPKLSTTVRGSIVYPYTMQDHLLRTKVDRTYKALFLENEYLKITCLPELGGRLHSVFDKTTGEEMFHLNDVVKPSMIAMRGAWFSGGVEWNTGPHGHTVTILSPVDALIGSNRDGSAFLEISNQEKIFRTRWTVRVTLHPDRAFIDEQIRIVNPTDGMHPYYFWNCTAFPCLPGTRFIYPMSVGRNHGLEFFSWPVHEGVDLSWLKNYSKPSSVFAVKCEHDFFGAYDVDLDRGIAQVADHHQLSGKKAWTWGQSDNSRVSQENLSDNNEAYIEVQSGPLPTQSDYGMLGPREQVSWQEYWLPVHGLGDGFEYATKNLVVQTSRANGKLQLHLLATGAFPQATCTLRRAGQTLLEERLDLSPRQPQVVTLDRAGQSPVEVLVKTNNGLRLASFVTPMPIAKVTPPDPALFVETPDEELTVEETYLKGRKHDRATDRHDAREYYEKTLAKDPGHVLALRGLAVLDMEAGLHERAIPRLQKALQRDFDQGLCWYFLGVCHLWEDDPTEAIRCAGHAVRGFGTASLGHDLAGRAYLALKKPFKAVESFEKAVRTNPRDGEAKDHLMLALYSVGNTNAARERARRRINSNPTALVPRALLALENDNATERFAHEARDFVGEDQFELLQTGLDFADLGLFKEAASIISATCVQGVADEQLSPLPFYYLAYWASLQGNDDAAEGYLRRASKIDRDYVFASRPEMLEVLAYALDENPTDANAHYHLGNLLASFGRVEEAIPHWQQAVLLNPSQSVAFRNLGLAHSALEDDPAKAAESYRKAIAARPDDQTLYRDLAEILIVDSKRPAAIKLLESMLFEGTRRADVIILLAGAYLDEKQYDKCLDLLESTPYFVNWEGQSITRDLFVKARLNRGQQRLAASDAEGALQDFEAALTYPANLGVGRFGEPEEAKACFFKGQALKALARSDEARAAFKAGAEGAENSEEQNEYRRRCRQALDVE